MEREPTADDVRAAWANFRHPWDFRKHPTVRIPLNAPMRAIDIVIPAETEAPLPVRVRHAEIRIEYGTLDGNRARRLIGTVPGTEISVELETVIKEEARLDRLRPELAARKHAELMRDLTCAADLS